MKWKCGNEVESCPKSPNFRTLGLGPPYNRYTIAPRARTPIPQSTIIAYYGTYILSLYICKSPLED